MKLEFNTKYDIGEPVYYTTDSLYSIVVSEMIPVLVIGISAYYDSDWSGIRVKYHVRSSDETLDQWVPEENLR